MSTSKWAGFPLLAFDIESTGINVHEDRIVQLALVEVYPEHRPVSTTYLVDPGIEIPAEATEVHGMTREFAAANATHTPEQMLFEVGGRIALWLGRNQPVVAYNAAYDFSIFEAECRRHDVPTLVDRLGGIGKVQPVLDPHVLDKQADPYRKGGRKLIDVCAHYKVIHTGAHDATADALAAARLFPRVMAKHSRKFPGQTLAGLHQAQIGWRATQMDGLRRYFDKNGTAHDGCNGEWPIQQQRVETAAAQGALL